MSEPGRWADLATRVASGLVLAVAGLGAVWAGGYVFAGFVSVVAGLIVWELARMLAPERVGLALALGALSGVAAFLAILLPTALVAPVLLVPVVAGYATLEAGRRRVFVTYGFYILLAAFGMMSLRNGYGFAWMLWLVLVVAATDIAGYFAGRLIGGAKFWPAISPKKTWAGIVAGWIAAGLVGTVFLGVTGAGPWLVALSVAAAFASQLGDIAESAVKRRCGVKDSSNLIPGHGGVFDRFDAMLAAALLVLLVIETTGFPPVPA